MPTLPDLSLSLAFFAPARLPYFRSESPASAAVSLGSRGCCSGGGGGRVGGGDDAMDGSAPYNPRTVEEVYLDFKGRRAGIVKALTTDVEEFWRQCDPDKENLCLYGYPNESWEVNLPAHEVPTDLPEPALGINFARDGMQEKDWISLVAVHSDSWLLALAFYFGARFGFDKNDRKRLFSMIDDLPTIFEVVNGKKQLKTSSTNNSNSKSYPSKEDNTCGYFARASDVHHSIVDLEYQAKNIESILETKLSLLEKKLDKFEPKVDKMQMEFRNRAMGVEEVLKATRVVTLLVILVALWSVVYYLY